MGVRPQLQEMQQVVKIHLPVPLRVRGQGQIDPGEFAGEPRPVGVGGRSVRLLVEEPFVAAVRLPCILLQ